MTDFLHLSDLCERAEGPDRELDARIWQLTDRPDADDPDRSLVIFDRIVVGMLSGGDDCECPAYSASLDAAMSLVPEDYDWAVFRTNGGLTIHAWCGSRDDVFAATPALALCSAALRALHAIKEQS